MSYHSILVNLFNLARGNNNLAAVGFDVDFDAIRAAPVCIPFLCDGEINSRRAAAAALVCEGEGGGFGELDGNVARGGFDVNIVYDNI